MSLNFLEDTAKNLANKIIPPIQRYFTYFFVVIGILWLGGANYYYYAEECPKFKGAFITGLIFFALASATALWEYFVVKKRTKKTDSNALSSSNELIVKALPIALPIIYKVFTRIISRPQTLKALAIVGFVGASFYYAFRSQKGKLDL